MIESMIQLVEDLWSVLGSPFSMQDTDLALTSAEIAEQLSSGREQ